MGWWPLRRGSTLSGSVAVSCPRCPRFRKCGFRRTNTMKVDLRSCTECVSEFDEPPYAQSKMSHVEAEHHLYSFFCIPRSNRGNPRILCIVFLYAICIILSFPVVMRQCVHWRIILVLINPFSVWTRPPRRRLPLWLLCRGLESTE